MMIHTVTFEKAGFAPSTAHLKSDGSDEALRMALADRFWGSNADDFTIINVVGPFDTEADATQYAAEQRYTDERLHADLADDRFPGPYRAAKYLLRLDTPARRLRAVSNAHTTMNLMGGRYSERIAESVGTIADMIATGREGEETYSERRSRELMEAERETRRYAF